MESSGKTLNSRSDLRRCLRGEGLGFRDEGLKDRPSISHPSRHVPRTKAEFRLGRVGGFKIYWSVLLVQAAPGLQGYLVHKKLQPPWDHHRALRIGLLQGPRRK